MKHIVKFSCILIAALIVFPLRRTRAGNIWQIGTWNTSGEFASSTNRIIDYVVPQNWGSLTSQNNSDWGDFPSVLSAGNDKENNPEVIRINFEYLKDYHNPILRIRAKVQEIDPIVPHYLEIFKGKGELFIRDKQIIIPSLFLYTFPVGYIKKGLHENNSIIIKSSGPPDISIKFDVLFLCLDDTDSDGDGISDADEVGQSTVCIPIKNYIPNPLIEKRITLHLEQTEEAIPVFHGVEPLDPNSLNTEDLLRINNTYLPYDVIDFRIRDFEPQTTVTLQISIPDPFSDFVHFYTYQDTNDWQEIPFEFIDGNTVSLSLGDGENEDLDGKANGEIHTTLAFTYPQGLDIQPEKRGCFIGNVSRRKKDESIP